MSPITLSIWREFAGGASTSLDLPQYTRSTLNWAVRRLIAGGHLRQVGTIYVSRSNKPNYVYEVTDSPPPGLVEIPTLPRAQSVFHLAAHLHQDGRMLRAVNESFRRAA